MKNFSYKDIAEIAKVSVSTVSRYYNGGYVSEKTKTKIEKIINDNRCFRSSDIEKSKIHDPNSIFIIVPEWEKKTNIEVVNGIYKRAYQKGRRSFVLYTPSSPEEYINTIKYAQKWKPGAIIFFLPNDKDEGIVNYIKTEVSNETISIVYGREIKGIDSIWVDYQKSFYSLTSVFLDLVNHGNDKNVAFVYEDSIPENKVKTRWNGFKASCSVKGIIPLRYSFSLTNVNSLKEMKTKLQTSKINSIVCATHSVYEILAATLKDINLCDIGYANVYDSFKTYKAKLFIDYVELGLKIEEMVEKAFQHKEMNENLKKDGGEEIIKEPEAILYKPRIFY
ncbi:LacI family DNA-binding transcriptional regulator [Mycoplasma sp. Mirounga ES2805-ORL]|uniref:LacI family DNA-binding transcriptional regulator n=1 Tax=Mycoplasma sp. Mirounga ES2805-ORL TaxID=754514 RepID=UPI00197C513E|nr:LacI family DNA-binding transcriptional regulator [Mycoplasma sp. Mirounga ES2805-ORL]QSF13404.1 LacI family DNA-binding transcriptional regulator [Mycoplasma sp. Mirounga ES2805-ORL]